MVKPTSHCDKEKSRNPDQMVPQDKTQLHTAFEESGLPLFFNLGESLTICIQLKLLL